MSTLAMALFCVCLPAPPAAAQSEPTLSDLIAIIEQQEELIRRQGERIDHLERRLDERALDDEVPISTFAEYPNEAEAPPARTPASGNGADTQPLDNPGRSNSEIGRFPDDTIVRPGSFDNSIRIPGSILALKIGGFAQVNLNRSFGDQAADGLFLPSLIPLSDTDVSRTAFLADGSRFNVDVRGDTELGLFRTFIEADFNGAEGNSLTTNSDGLRLLHAYGQLGNLYAGQYWSLFSDVESFPETLNPTSPSGKPLVRQVGVRYVGDLSAGLSYAIAMENPASRFSGPQSSESLDNWPDLLAGVTLERDWGRIRLVGLVRALRARTEINGETRSDSEIGWGLNMTGRIDLPFLEDQDNLVFGVGGGESIGRYHLELAFDGLDGTVSADGTLQTVPTWTAHAGYQHWWSDTLRSTATYGLIVVGRTQSLDDDDPRMLQIGTVNLVWSPVAMVDLGAEIVIGARETQSGEQTDASRLQFLGRFRF
ncbi:DcaP family trimeric outer membrane transporter [Aestuariibius sp. 2305UL40-4]|uniref:DcaP family trimeric outer membrane transporter n=1 Tax=Aestuariibius violaceus TaxID=3234132 RepID=UPI00345E196E